MRKNILKLLSAVLAALLLCSCAAPSGLKEELESIADCLSLGSEEALPFDSLEYKRPEKERFGELMAGLEPLLARSETSSELYELLDSCYYEYYHFYTMMNLADVRSCQDVTDACYAEEYAWCSANFSLAQQFIEDVLYSCGESALAPALEAEYFWEGFQEEYSSRSSCLLSDEAVELMQRESELVSRCRELTASPVIELPGLGAVDYNSYISQAAGEDYDEALLLYYESVNQEISELYIQLIGTRRELAELMGFASYEEFQYSYGYGRDYTPGQAAEYIEEIKRWILPLYKDVMAREPYGELEFYPLSQEKLLRDSGAAIESMSGDIKDVFDFMTQLGYCDTERRENKAPMSFQTYFTEFEVPFLFMDACGDMSDYMVFSHEFGHFLDAFVNYDAYETIDMAESYSQAMEYLMLCYYSEVLSPEEMKQLYGFKMLDTLDTYIQQAAYSEFESRVYSAPPEELTAEYLNGLSLELAREYGYSVEGREELYAMSWMDVLHYFEMPFYVITYPVSNDAAMQIYALETAEPGQGLNKLLEILPRNYESFAETLEAGGLESPFAPGRLEAVSLILEDAFRSLDIAA